MSKPPANIHDAFFKRVMSEPDCAGRFLRERLPCEVAALLSDDSPELQSGSFVDEEMAQHQTDLLFRLTLREGGDALIYVLAEHKSAPDPLARLQLLRYVTRILVHWHRENRRLPLPPVVPLIAHHGPSGWSFSTDFAEMYGDVADSLRPYLINFRHVLVDLVRIEDRNLSQYLRLRAFLMALKYVFHVDLIDHIEDVLADATSLDRMDLGLVLQYIESGPVRIGREILLRTLRRLMPEKAEMLDGFFVKGYFDQVGREFFAKGKAEGNAEGKAEGKATSLIQVLELRFGPLAVSDRDRILSSDVASIEGWMSRAVKENSLEAVFE